MKIKVLLFSVLFSSMGLAVYAQKPVIEFKEKVHDFGTIKEEDGAVSHTFEFESTGDSPLIISNVKASCGCTTPKWTKEPVAPGNTGSVSATYNTKGRPGSFVKTITITSNAGKTVLTIKGEVIPRQPSPTELYPIEAGNVRLRSNNIGIWDIASTQNKSQKITVYNPSETNAVAVSFANVPKHIKLPASTEIKPKQSADIEFLYAAAEANDYGVRNDEFYIVIDGKKELAPKNKITVSATIKEDLSQWNGDKKALAPKATFDTESLQLGVMKPSEKKITKVKITNNGQSPLEVRKVTSNTNLIVPSAVKATVAPGKSVEIKLTVQAQGNEGDFNKTVTFITNDPDKQTAVVTVSGKVEK